MYNIKFYYFFPNIGIFNELFNYFNYQINILLKNVKFNNIKNNKCLDSSYYNKNCNLKTSEELIYKNKIDAGFVTFGSFKEVNNYDYKELFSAYPFMPDPLEYLKWINTPGNNYLNDFFKNKNIIGFPIFFTPSSSFLWTKKKFQINKENLNNKNIRAFGYQGEIFKKFGANISYISPEYIYEKINSELLDGFEILDLYTDTEFISKLIEDKYYVHLPAIHENTNIIYLTFNKKCWDKIDINTQNIIKSICNSCITYSLSTDIIQKNTKIFNKLEKTKNVLLLENNFIKKFNDEWLKIIYSKSCKFIEIYKDIEKFRQSNNFYNLNIKYNKKSILIKNRINSLYIIQNNEDKNKELKGLFKYNEIEYYIYDYEKTDDSINEENISYGISIPITQTSGSLLDEINKINLNKLKNIFMLFSGGLIFVYNAIEDIKNSSEYFLSEYVYDNIIHKYKLYIIQLDIQYLKKILIFFSYYNINITSLSYNNLNFYIIIDEIFINKCLICKLKKNFEIIEISDINVSYNNSDYDHDIIISDEKSLIYYI